jgi:hypothetical protein
MRVPRPPSPTFLTRISPEHLKSRVTCESTITAMRVPDGDHAGVPVA